MKISELKNICEFIEKEVGPEVEVFLQLRDNHGLLSDCDYCNDAFLKPYNILVLGNYELENKEECRPWKTGANMNQNSDI